MVDRNHSRSDFRVATCDAAAGNGFCGRVTIVLDGRGISAAAPCWTTAGLLLHEHVERFRALDRHRLGPNATAAADYRRKCGRALRIANRRRCADLFPFC